ncbi:hypothetical protein [Deinococcus hohokamensis]|uniref:DUF3168 domain-containing protein n=1 Tax=Deinococcus hohokamensis TaxID=309883 RepID=A0ABV9I4D4_9DEIO
MGQVVDDLHTRLTAALGKDVPVLYPGEFTEPDEAAPLDAQGRPMVGGGERGLGRYLAQHPTGYVQLQHDTGVGSSGYTDVGLATLEVIASTAEAADALAGQVRRAIGNLLIRPTPYTYQTRTTLEVAGFTRLLLSFEARQVGLGV